MLEAEGPQGSYKKVLSPHFIDEKLNGAADTPVNFSISEAYILTPQTPLLLQWGSSHNWGKCKQSKGAAKHWDLEHHQDPSAS